MTDYENVGNCVDTLGNGDFARWNTHVADSFYVEHASAREFWNTSFGRGTDLFEDPPSVPLVGGGEGGREGERNEDGGRGQESRRRVARPQNDRRFRSRGALSVFGDAPKFLARASLGSTL